MAVCDVAEPVEDVWAWELFDGPAAEEDAGCEDEAFVAIARADWEI